MCIHRRRLFASYGKGRTPFIPSPILFFPALLSPPFRSRATGSGELCKLSVAKPQPTMILCILESKSAALVAAVFVDFPNKCNFLHKKKLHTIPRYHLYHWRSKFTVKERKNCSWVQFLIGRRPKVFFSWGSRHDCPMVVGACVSICRFRQWQKAQRSTEED